MIERLQKISADLFKNALKTYTRNDVLIHKRSHSNNLSQLLLLYPNGGVNFFVSKKSWPQGLHYQIARSAHKSNRNGVFYGLKRALNHKGKQISCYTRPIRLHGFNKRGIWTYRLGNFEKCKTDNGLIYSRADLEAYMRVSGVGIQKANSANNQAEQGSQVAQEQSV